MQSSISLSIPQTGQISELKYCWLVNRLESVNDRPHFLRSIKSIQNFRIFWNVLLPEQKFGIEQFEKYYQIYTNELKDNWDQYKNNILTQSDDPIRKKLRSDLTRTIGKHRNDHQFAKDPSTKVDSVMQWFSQMFIFIDKRIIKYMQGFCDLLLPIFHVFFQGLLAINDSLDFVVSDSSKYVQPDFPVIQKNTFDYIALTASACSVFAFQGLMISSLHFHEQFPPNKKIEESMEKLKNKLKQRHEFANFVTQEEYSPSRFAMRWFLLLFTQDLKFPETIELWGELFRPNGAFEAPTFVDKVIKVCECAAILNFKNYVNDKVASFLEVMQKTSNLTFADLKATALVIK